jgi:hypothetical protein
VGYATDARGVLKEVAEACVAFPDMPHADAVFAVHMRFEKENR